jgi:Pyruvate phosphate dikinase, AMP/ATP-binding domain
MKAVKYVYFFGDGEAEGNREMKDELGGKGAALAEMTNAGLPVPPGFTIQTEACREYMRHGGISTEAAVVTPMLVAMRPNTSDDPAIEAVECRGITDPSNIYQTNPQFDG